MESTKSFREETDLLGNKEIPSNAFYGINAERAIENFHISGHNMSEYPYLIKGFAMIKK